jgi:hypothetical protein
MMKQLHHCEVDADFGETEHACTRSLFGDFTAKMTPK